MIRKVIIALVAAIVFAGSINVGNAHAQDRGPASPSGGGDGGNGGPK